RGHEPCQPRERKSDAEKRDAKPRVARRDRTLVRRPELDRQVLKDERKAEADQQRVLDPLLLGEMGDSAEQADVEQDTHAEQQRAADEEGHKGIDAPQSEQPEAEIASQHEQLAVGGIEHIEDAEYE